MRSPIGDARAVLVAGKGGVGSTTVAGALAVALARAGADVLVASVDGRADMGRLIGGRDLDDRDRVLRRFEGGGAVRGRFVRADQAFGDYLDLRGVGGFLRRAASSTSLPMIAAATPGLEHLLVLGKIKELDNDRVADVIIVDAPPAGHAAPFLRSASGLADVVADGPVREQADEVRSFLTDPTRCAVCVVALPETTPVTEAIELANEVRDELGISLARPVLNACWPDRPGLDRTPGMASRSAKTKLDAESKRALEVAAAFGRERLAIQRAQFDRISSALGEPVCLPRLTSVRLDRDLIDRLAGVLSGEASDVEVAAAGPTPGAAT